MKAKERIVKNRVNSLMKIIPEFIDTKFEESYIVYNNIVDILVLFNVCINDNFLSKNKIEELATKYYSHLLSIYNTDKCLYTLSVNYIVEVGNEINEYLCEYEMYESMDNISKMIKV